MAESRWVAYELHDGLMQWVIGARMHLAALVASLELPDAVSVPPEVEERLGQILTYLNQASEEGRQLIRFVEGLPPNEQQVDLVAVLKSTTELLLRKTRDGRPSIAFQSPLHGWPTMDPRFAWMIVRIVQQAATNAIQHSQADSVRVELGGGSDGQLTIVIVDDGIGFDPQLQRPGHCGLRSMRQRAREARVAIEFLSAPQGGGTRVELRFKPQLIS